ncbi:unnamed protein product [Calicophoron daubneyi]|uniref:Ig-like domain-containing protein n=1 Tax=Calicophoron daubneyi TaxID=300641 RepID=A0AAV2SXZ7_CALDB
MIAFLVLTQIICSAVAYNKNEWVLEGSNVTICCPQDVKGSEGLTIKGNDIRIHSMYMEPGKDKVKRITGDYENFKTKYPGWDLGSTKATENKLCVRKLSGLSIKEDDGLVFQCQKANDFGMGETVDVWTTRVNVYRPVEIISCPENVTARQGQTVHLRCKATGYPGLEIQWKSNTNTSTRDNNTSKVEREVDLVLSDVRPEQHEEVFVCEAKTSYPAGRQTARCRSVLFVLVPPNISLPSDVIYTDLNANESFEIRVTGYPIPFVRCDGLTVVEDRKISDKPPGGVYTYTLTVNGVREKDLKNYRCVAINEAGTAHKELRLTVEPSIPEILSPNVSSLADYHMLKWQARSKAPLKNVTIEIEEYPTSNKSSSLVARSIQTKKLTFNLNPGEQKDIHTSIWQPSDKKQNTVWHHLSNLSEDTKHAVTLKVCNSYACKTSSSDLRGTTFRTAKFNGTNKVRREVLQSPPIDTQSYAVAESPIQPRSFFHSATGIAFRSQKSILLVSISLAYVLVCWIV